MHSIVGVGFYWALRIFTPVIIPMQTLELLSFFMLSGVLIDMFSSMLLDPLFRKTKFLNYTNYHAYVRKAREDNAIEDLNCQKILYRNLSGLLLVVLLVLADAGASKGISLVVMFLFLLAVFRMKKFHNYIQKRLSMN